MTKTKNIIKKDTTGVSAKEYAQTLAELKKQVQEAQVKAVLAANKELIKLYWIIGKTIAEKQELNGWGSKIIEKLAKDLQNEFPGIGGFSKLNLFRMRAFYLAYYCALVVEPSEYTKVSQAVTQIEELPIFRIPWGHNIVILHKVKDNEERLWYAQKAIEYG
ncbi:MAG TPA: DUF1016 N-terminal domain-containing protein [Candidatus Babeliaceae bacterium]|nr:DUF1016 N-terminal domain-containing protein [Candidatus Babeliaceae bacterium]